jgi:hypothetical protein
MIGSWRETPGQCDGVRCDMAMLVLPECSNVPGHPADLFYEGNRVGRRKHPDFLFGRGLLGYGMDPQQQGFD